MGSCDFVNHLAEVLVLLGVDCCCMGLTITFDGEEDEAIMVWWRPEERRADPPPPPPIIGGGRVERWAAEAEAPLPPLLLSPAPVDRVLRGTKKSKIGLHLFPIK